MHVTYHLLLILLDALIKFKEKQLFHLATNSYNSSSIFELFRNPVGDAVGYDAGRYQADYHHITTCVSHSLIC